MTEKPPSDTEGQRLFDSFLRNNDLTLADAAKPLDVSEVAVLNWRSGKKRPIDHQRTKIEIWTGGAVPASAWRTPEEREEIEAVRPFATQAVA